VAPKSSCQPPHHEGRWSRLRRAPGWSEVERCGGRAEEGRGAGVHWYLIAKGAKTAKDSTAMALRP